MRAHSLQSTSERILSLVGLALLAVLALTRTVRAQIPPIDPQSAGRTYVIAFPDTTTNLNDPRFPSPFPDALIIFIYSAVSNEVSIVGRNYSRTINLRGGRFETVYLNTTGSTNDNAIVTTSGEISNNTFRVEARDPIIIYCSMQTAFGGEMWAPIPVENWGKEYHVAAMPGELIADMYLNGKFRFERTPDVAPSEMLIVAAFDGTTVKIQPNSALMIPAAPTVVTLNANQAYQLQSYADTLLDQQPDMGGSHIVANRPIGVISGNTRSQVVTMRQGVTNNTMRNMLIEWLPSVEQYGTEFVYLPSWDTRRSLGIASERDGQKRLVEVVRVYGSSAAPSAIHYYHDTTSVETSSVMSRSLQHYTIAANAPAYIRTEEPAQAMMMSTPTIEAILETSANMGARIYSTWSTHMVELVPREQWTTFAPIYVPSLPYDMRHYINVVADTNALDKVFDRYGAPFDFNMGAIVGTSLMWGTTELTPDQTYYLEAKEGATFYAYQYGLRPGREYYRPDTVIHSPEYQEIMSLAYGMPLAPRRSILRPGDSLRIDTLHRPCEFNVKLRAANPNPVGFRSIEMEPGSINAHIELIQPSGPGGVIGLTEVELYIAPIDRSRDASGMLIATDRTGKRTGIPFFYKADRPQILPAQSVDFTEVAVNNAQDTVITLTNTSDKEMCINNIRLRHGNQAISVLGTSPAGPALAPAVPVSLPPGEQMQIRIRATPLASNRFYADTLRVALCCSELQIPLTVRAAIPCIDVQDLDFGVLNIGQQATQDLQICNQGQGHVTFGNPSGDSVITWLTDVFTVAQQDLDRLRSARLGPGDCIAIPVTFLAQQADTFRTVARLWANTRDCRDTSLWYAIVRKPASTVEPHGALSGTLRIAPNPTSGRAAFHVATPVPGYVSLDIYNSLGEKIAGLVNGPLHSGNHAFVWDGSAEPPGLYYCKLMINGHTTTQTVMIQR